MPRVGVQRIDSGWTPDPKRFERALRDVLSKVAKPAVLKMCKEVVEGKRYSNTGRAWRHKTTVGKALDAQLMHRFDDFGGNFMLGPLPLPNGLESFTCGRI